MDELSQLDELIESDILEALGEEIPENIQEENNTTTEEEINIEDFVETENLQNEEIAPKEETISLEEDDINIENLEEEILLNENENEDSISEEIINNSNPIDLASLLSQLLNNKTIEITIKIKD